MVSSQVEWTGNGSGTSLDEGTKSWRIHYQYTGNAIASYVEIYQNVPVPYNNISPFSTLLWANIRTLPTLKPSTMKSTA